MTDLQVKTAPSRKVFTVSELTRQVRFVLEDRFSSVWVEGEISNFLHHGSRHMYFSLKDAESAVACAMFRDANGRLRFTPQNGLQVLVRGRVSIYAPRGQYQLIVDEMQPKGVGDLQLAFEQLKKKLGDEGLFDPARKRPIPPLPRRIGLVTSLTGAVIRDMLHVLGRRFPGVPLLVAPAQVQGAEARFEIVRALEALNAHGGPDVIVLARGGGSLEDLWPFNEEAVARAIAGSRVPVVSAVGHETDYTIADFAADLRAPTPSAAAEILVPDGAELRDRIGEARRRLEGSVRGRVEALSEECRRLMASSVFRHPGAFVEERIQRLDEAAGKMRRAFAGLWELGRERLRSAAGRLEALSPLACLARGYSITFDASSGRTVRSVKELKPGSEVRTRLADGSFVGRVTRADPLK
jgi:exodeoxyribonuclease VII large subunit